MKEMSPEVVQAVLHGYSQFAARCAVAVRRLDHRQAARFVALALVNLRAELEPLGLGHLIDNAEAELDGPLSERFRGVPQAPGPSPALEVAGICWDPAYFEENA